MEIAAKVRKILHSHGVHSITIQPEYVKVGLNSNDSGEVIMVVENSKKKGGLELVANDIVSIIKPSIFFLIIKKKNLKSNNFEIIIG